MATKNVNIDIIAKDKTRQAMQSATTNVEKVKSAVFNLRNALIGLGAGVSIKSFVTFLVVCKLIVSAYFWLNLRIRCVQLLFIVLM